ncbi:MAG: hypothetical protein HOV81_30405 [Kofleriaceae bacterium]|nr:hypothetical protein [Kofleriaceae bacterium]
MLVLVAACGSSDLRTDAGAGDASPDAPAPWSVRQLGGPGSDAATSVGVDAAGTIYVAGTTSSALGVSTGGADLFVTAIPTSGDGWVTQLGSTGDEALEDLTITDDGVAITGVTDGVLPGQTSHGLQDIVVARIDASGATRWSTQYGTAGHDRGQAIVARDGGLLVAGVMDEQVIGDDDIRLDTLSASGQLVASDAIRTGAPERAEGLALDGNGGVFVAGAAAGPLVDGWAGSFDAFVLGIGALGERPSWGSQRGTEDIDAALDVALDAAGNIYVLAISFSDLDSGGFENDGRASAFVMKYAADSRQLVWTRRIGTAAVETFASKLAVDAAGHVFVAGTTRGALGLANAGGFDAYVAILDGDGAVVHVEQLGTAADDRADDVVITDEDVIVVGSTGGDLAGTGSHGGADAFVARFSRSSLLAAG